MDDRDRAARLAGIARGFPPLMAALRAGRSLGLASWCIGGGAVRNLVWDRLHGLEPGWPPADVDLVFFEADDLTPQREQALRVLLHAAAPELPWEVTNQAAVHRWYGGEVAPLGSLAEGLATWPETATAVGLTLDAAGTLRVVAPLGLADLFDGVVRHNPRRAGAEVYRARVAAKGFAARWPGLTVLPPDDPPA